MVPQKKVYLLDGLRTPLGKFGGSLKDINPVDLSVLCSNPLLDRNQKVKNLIDEVIFANVIPSTPDTLYGARHLALKLGLPESTPGYSVNRLCGSGIEAIIQAKELVESGKRKVVLVSGAENMSMAPHLTYGARFGTKYGSLKTKDSLLDTLQDEFAQITMGMTTENIAEKFSISKEQSDDFSYESHKKSIKAYEANLLQEEIVPIELKRKTITKDEHIRFDVQREDFNNLRPSFKKDGVVTPGTASGIVDGAASVLVISEEVREQFQQTPLCELGKSHVVGVDPKYMGCGPIPAIGELLKKIDKKIDDIDLYEINEAFAAQVLGCARELSLPMDKLNSWGGGVSHGHPLGATGVKLTLTLARQLNKLSKNLGIVSACIGGGQGIALCLKRYEA